ncbi:MAG: enoyl-CoA hydratase/isomerase family protein [Thermoanaerobaculia bacterium]
MSTRSRLDYSHDGRVARLVLAAPKANVLDRQMMGEMEAACGELAGRRDLHAGVIVGEGPTFSFGASVEEHLPDQIGPTLDALDRLLSALLALPAPTLAAVRGQCLGGGFELALACDLILAEETASLGCPEIKLAVFPPAASALLPARIGAGPAAELLLTGRSWTGLEAAQHGLVARLAGEGALEDELEAWLEVTFLPLSPAALRHAVGAARRPVRRALDQDLPDHERRYCEELMAEPDAVEGLQAFLEKRKPRWSQAVESS